jgi:ABC-type sugar transport system permease subunit
MRYGKYRFIASFLAIPLLLYVVFVVSPYVQAIFISVTDWRGFSQNRNFIGLSNYVDLLGDAFNAILAHAKDAPPLPVQQHRDEFVAYAAANNLTSVLPFYSAYPNLTVLDILALAEKG